MKTRKSTLELTPLLDVVLILLFVFMLLLANQVNESTKVKQEAEESVAAAQDDLDSALTEVSSLEDELANLTDDYEALEQANFDASEMLEKQKEISDNQQKTAEDLAKAVAEFVDANEYDVKKLLDENGAVSKEMLDSMSIDNIAEEMLKYEAISRQFYFIDLELKSANNRLYINDASTPVGISREETLDINLRQSKINDIKKIIEEEMEQRQGGSQMVFITLKVNDRHVYQYARQLVWDAIGEIQEKYGTDKVFRTEIIIYTN